MQHLIVSTASIGYITPVRVICQSTTTEYDEDYKLAKRGWLQMPTVSRQTAGATTCKTGKSYKI